MLQLIIFSTKTLLLLVVPWVMKKKAMATMQPLTQVIIQALIGKLHCILKLHLLLANIE